MTEFNRFKLALQNNLDEMQTSQLYEVDLTKDELWEAYLAAFPEGTNTIFRERTEHDCQCCKKFIRDIGKAVSIADNQLISIWDIDVGGTYQVVADRLKELVTSSQVANYYVHSETCAGVDVSHEQLEDGSVRTWEHLFTGIPAQFIKDKDNIPTYLGKVASSKQVFKRALEEISLESVETVLDLIAQNSLYKGDEYSANLKKFMVAKTKYLTIDDKDADTYVWGILPVTADSLARIRNSAIGTLLVDLSEGKELDYAVTGFEKMVAPENYKRPTALITKMMIKKAQEKVTELGIEPALERRHATQDDITINNVLYADKSVRQALGVFDQMTEEVAVNQKQFTNVDEVSVDTFIKYILPNATGIELMLENTHINNMMNLVAPVHADAKSILKWDNNFTWSYSGEFTDSIKTRVKAAGGNVAGVLRCSLAWFNADDLDIHIREPDGTHIHHAMRRSTSSGVLDVDMNAGGATNKIDPVENITWSNKHAMQEGIYSLYINNYNKRSSVNPGFIVEIEHNGKTHTFNYEKAVRDNGNIQVAKFNFSHTEGIKFIEQIPSQKSSKQMWDIHTHTFTKVNMVMDSPNHWDNQKIGNKHLFFILDKCHNPDTVRGFYNEFLSNDLTDHRKVFEVLGSKMKVPTSEQQLAGIGFSSSQRNEILCKVSGSFSRVVKIKF